MPYPSDQQGANLPAQAQALASNNFPGNQFYGDPQGALTYLQGQSNQGGSGYTGYSSTYPGSYVFMGDYNVSTRYPWVQTAEGKSGRGGFARTATVVKSPARVGVDEASDWLLQQFETNSPDFQRVRQEMIDAGVVPANPTFEQMQNAWDGAVLASYKSGLYRSATLTPEDYLRKAAALNQQVQSTPVTWTSTSTSRTVHNAADLAAGYQSVSEQALGRRATPAEAARAGGAVGAQANASPDTSTTTETVNNATHTRTSNTVNRPGMGADAINDALLQQAMAQPDYAEFQAAGHYFPALLSALGAVTNAGA